MRRLGPCAMKRWGCRSGLSGERYQRFPRGFDEGGPGSEYLWHKQYFLSRQLSRKEACDPGIIGDTVGSWSPQFRF